MTKTVAWLSRADKPKLEIYPGSSGIPESMGEVPLDCYSS
jgi:hypothetical protein